MRRWKYLLGGLLCVFVAALIPLITSFNKSYYCEANEVPGVAFDLAPDYGTVAVHLEDGSSVAVAKIEGSPAYKTFMRRQNAAAGPQKASYLDGLEATISFLLGVDSLHKDAFKDGQEADRSAVKVLLQSLQVAAESYLDHSICLVNLSLPKKRESGKYQHDIALEALHQTQLARVTESIYSPSLFAIVGNGLGNHSDPDKLVLVIDQSNYGFAIGVYFVEDGLIDAVRHNHHFYDQGIDTRRRYNALKQALEEIIEPPFGEFPGMGEISDVIEELVLYGDDIWNPDFHKTLETVFDLKLISNARKHRPVYSAALGLAENTFVQVNYPTAQMKSKTRFGCCWKSNGKACPIDWGFWMAWCQ